MLRKQCTVSNVKNMADGSIRLTVDLINGNGDDIKEAYELREQETTIVLSRTNDMLGTVQALADELVVNGPIENLGDGQIPGEDFLPG